MPALLGEEAFEVGLSLLDILSIGESPALGQAMNMCIDREGWDSVGLAHYDRGRFMPHSRQCFQICPVLGHLGSCAFRLVS